MHPSPCTSLPTADRGGILLPIARASIASRFGLQLEADEQENFLFEPGASFVTLQLAGKLRGCIGSLEATRTLLLDVKANAQAAAFRDPRFPPLAAGELDRMRIEVSLLSALQPIEFADEGEAASALRPEEDGVVLAWGEKRGTFLPQVWETIPRPLVFLAELKRKAGLPADFWAGDLKLYRYTVEKWSEPV
jgi:AmmeMemoRadiSam system protein A